MGGEDQKTKHERNQSDEEKIPSILTGKATSKILAEQAAGLAALQSWARTGFISS
jgi:hypothetical protein